MTPLDIIGRELTSADEWLLAGGQRIGFAPSHPDRLDEGGIRDAARYRRHEIKPVFAVTILDENAVEIPLNAASRDWNPARLELNYRAPQGLFVERRCILPLDAFVSHWTITHAAPTCRHFWMVLWTRRAVSEDNAIVDVDANSQGISFQESRAGADVAVERWGCALGATFDADSWSVSSAPHVQAAFPPRLDWDATPFFDLMTSGGLPGNLPDHELASGEVYFGLAYPFEIPAGERFEVSFAAAFAPDIEQARSNLERATQLVNPIQASEEQWINWFDEAPGFSCSDPRLRKLYWHRWALERLRMTEGFGANEIGNESPSFARASGIIDASWMNSPDAAATRLERLFDSDDRAALRTPIAHAARRVFSIHPDRELRQHVLRRLTDQLDSKGKRPPLDRSVQRAPWITAPAQTDSLEHAVFTAASLDLAEWLEKSERAFRSSGASSAEAAVSALRKTFWDDEAGFFLEVIREGDKSRPARTAFGFLPLLLDQIDESMRSRTTNVLFDPEYFWTRVPVPSLSRDDPDFSAEGFWKNERVDRPFHGRVWPELNCLVIDALANGIERGDCGTRVLVAELIERTLQLSLESDDSGSSHPVRTAEHHHPLSGRPARYLDAARPTGGPIIDLILRYVAGIRPREDGQLIIDPLPFRLDWFEVTGIMIGNHEIDVEWDHRTGVSVRVDDEPAGHAPVGRAICIALPDHWLE